MNYINHLLSNTMINHNLPTGGLWRIQHSFIIQPRAYVQSYMSFYRLRYLSKWGGGGDGRVKTT